MNRYRKLFVKIIRFVTVLSAMTALPASATENGTTAFPSGADDFLVAAMPPPGVYGILYGNRFRADQLNGNAGETLPLNFSLSVNALVPRLDWVRPVQFLGADRWGTLLILPLLDVSVALTPAPGVNIAGKKSGVGDLVIGNALHWTMGDFHMLNAVDVVVPTGRYQARDVVNLGRNQWVLRLNHMGTWLPGGNWDVSYRLHWDNNFRNRDTDYRSGQTAYLGYAIGWKPSPPATIGISGYVLKQISDDRQGGQVVAPNGNRLAVRGIGPVVKYFFDGGVFVTLKHYRESSSRNGPTGNQTWLYLGMPL